MKQLLASIGAHLRIFILGTLAALIMVALNKTLRWRYEGLAGDESFSFVGSAKILAFWHSRQLMMPFLYLCLCRQGKFQRCHALISKHGDGRIIARAIKWFKLGSVAGSSTRGGQEGLAKLIDRAQAGDNICFTPDGPKGPIQEVKMGVIKAAQKTGAPICPFAYSAERRWQFGSWDRMILPKPFSRAVVILGEPLVVPKETPNEALPEYASKLELKLNELLEAADNYSYA